MKTILFLKITQNEGAGAETLTTIMNCKLKLTEYELNFILSQLDHIRQKLNANSELTDS